MLHMLVAGIAGLVVLGSGIASAQDAAAIDRGQKVYAAQKCFVCHAVAGQGNKKGALDGMAATLSADELRLWITDAPEMAKKAKADRKPAMKAYTALTKEELDELVAYLQSLKK
ncbi:MAG: cytochrome c [Acidobacteria bacterium]|nr:cytochrome c [Acidobacteriota bacterium]